MIEKLIVALDFDSLEGAEKMVDELYPTVKIFKIGYQLFLKNGWDAVRKIKLKGADIFLDLKLFDIPNTVSRASAIMALEDVFMFNLHALGGYEMMRAAVEAVRAFNTKTLMIAVTLLTSFDEKSLVQVGVQSNIEEEVIKLAALSKEAGLNGVVASPREARKIKEVCGKEFIVVCPGVRLLESSKDDQKRIATPREAVDSGADYIVVGRPITQAENPLLAAEKIKEQISPFLK